jgi:hypothetical protein
MTTHLLPGIAELVISEGSQATTCIDISKQGKNAVPPPDGTPGGEAYQQTHHRRQRHLPEE